METKLAAIWTEFLGVRDIGRKDDFFELGGDSLTLVRLTLAIEEAFGKKIRIGTFVQARSPVSPQNVSLVHENLRGRLDDQITDPCLANNRVIAVSKQGPGATELLVVFERAAEQRGNKAYFHDWEETLTTVRSARHNGANSTSRDNHRCRRDCMGT